MLSATQPEVKEIGVVRLPLRTNDQRTVFYGPVSVRLKNSEVQVRVTKNIALPQNKDAIAFQNDIATAIEGLDEAKADYVVAAYGEESKFFVSGWGTANESEMDIIRASGKLG